VLQPFTSANAAKDLILLMPSVSRNEDQHRLSNDFFGGISEDSLCCPVPTLDDTVEVFAGNCVFGRLYDRGQMLSCAEPIVSL
jgi:hypothetical protein